MTREEKYQQLVDFRISTYTNDNKPVSTAEAAANIWAQNGGVLVGMTEWADAAYTSKKWMTALTDDVVQGLVLITKARFGDIERFSLQKPVRHDDTREQEIGEFLKAHSNRIVVHFTITGMGGTYQEPGVPYAWDEQLKWVNDFCDRFSFPREHVFIRVDPIIAEEFWIERAKTVIRRAAELGFKKIKYSWVDIKKYLAAYEKYGKGPDLKTRYKKAGRRLPTDVQDAKPELIRAFVYDFCDEMEEKYDMRFSSCAEIKYRQDKHRDGCVGLNTLKLLGLERGYVEPDGKQRQECDCCPIKIEVSGRKWGTACTHQCRYCYVPWVSETAADGCTHNCGSCAGCDHKENVTTDPSHLYVSYVANVKNVPGATSIALGKTGLPRLGDKIVPYMTSSLKQAVLTAFAVHDGNLSLLFVPTWEIVDGYKKGEITVREYTRKYLDQVLAPVHRAGLTPQVLLDLCRKAGVTHLCCSEDLKSPDQLFCHRMILQAWFKRFGLELPEWDPSAHSVPPTTGTPTPVPFDKPPVTPSKPSSSSPKTIYDKDMRTYFSTHPIVSDIFSTGAAVLINPVNCQSTMKQGIAKQFKDQYPEMFKNYCTVCGLNSQEIPNLFGTLKDVGDIHVWQGSGVTVINLAIKRLLTDYTDKAVDDKWYEAIHNGLIAIREWALKNRPSSIAIPVIGAECMNSDWARIRAMILSTLGDLFDKTTGWYCDLWIGDIKGKNGRWVINSFHRPGFEWLSNMHMHKIPMKDAKYTKITYSCVEAAYQSCAKLVHVDSNGKQFGSGSKEYAALLQFNGIDGYTAKKVGKRMAITQNKFNSDPTFRNIVMKYWLTRKFGNATLKSLLAQTEGYELVEGNPWGDQYWGISKGEGQNILGRLLMEIRGDEPPTGSVLVPTESNPS